MGRFSKAIAGGLGSSISTIVAMIARHVITDMTPDQAQALEYFIYTIITTAFVYIAPPNKPADLE